jgi:hypothetical protein
MKATSLFIFFLVSFFTTNLLNAQDIYVKVKKGIVKVNTTSLSESSAPYLLKKTDAVLVESNSMALLRSGNTFKDLVTAKKYTFQDIANLFPKTSSSTAGAYADLLFNEKYQSQKSQGGSATRSVGKAGDFYFPNDSVKIISKDLELLIGNESTKLTSNVLIVNVITNDTIYNGPAKNNVIQLSDLKEGVYNWSYSILYKKTKSSVNETDDSFLNIFVVPSKKDKTSFLNDLKKFRKEIKDLSEEMKTVLEAEYMSINKLYHK